MKRAARTGWFGSGPTHLLASAAVRTLVRVPLLLLIALTLVLGGCAGDGQLGGPRLGGTAAARIGDHTITPAELEAEIEQWSSNPAFLQLIGVDDIGEPGRRSSDVVSFVLSNRVVSEQARQIAAQAGIEPSEEEIDALIQQVDASFTEPTSGAPLFQVFPEDFRRRLGADLAYQSVLQGVDPESVEVPEVEISSRFGSFEDQGGGFGQVRPPEGPLPQRFGA